MAAHRHGADHVDVTELGALHPEAEVELRQVHGRLPAELVVPERQALERRVPGAQGPVDVDPEAPALLGYGLAVRVVHVEHVALDQAVLLEEREQPLAHRPDVVVRALEGGAVVEADQDRVPLGGEELDQRRERLDVDLARAVGGGPRRPRLRGHLAGPLALRAGQRALARVLPLAQRGEGVDVEDADGLGEGVVRVLGVEHHRLVVGRGRPLGEGRLHPPQRGGGGLGVVLAQQRLAAEVVAPVPDAVHVALGGAHGERVAPVGLRVLGVVRPDRTPQRGVVVEHGALDDPAVDLVALGAERVPEVVGVVREEPGQVLLVAVHVPGELVAEHALLLLGEVLVHLVEGVVALLVREAGDLQLEVVVVQAGVPGRVDGVGVLGGGRHQAGLAVGHALVGESLLPGLLSGAERERGEIRAGADVRHGGSCELGRGLRSRRARSTPRDTTGSADHRHPESSTHPGFPPPQDHAVT